MCDDDHARAGRAPCPTPPPTTSRGCRRRRGTSRRTRSVPAGGAVGGSRQRAAGSACPISFVLPASQPAPAATPTAAKAATSREPGRTATLRASGAPGRRCRRTSRRPATRAASAASGRGTVARLRAPCRRGPRRTTRGSRSPSRSCGEHDRPRAGDRSRRAATARASRRRARARRSPRPAARSLPSGSTRSRRDRRRRRGDAPLAGRARRRHRRFGHGDLGGRSLRDATAGAGCAATRGAGARTAAGFDDVARIRRRRPRRPPTRPPRRPPSPSARPRTPTSRAPTASAIPAASLISTPLRTRARAISFGSCPPRAASMTDSISVSSSGGCRILMTKPLPLVGLGTVLAGADARQRLAQLRARGPQPPVGRVQVDLQRLGGLWHRQLLDVDQHDDRALVLVQRIEQAIEQRDRLAPRDQLGGPGRRRRHHLDDVAGRRNRPGAPAQRAPVIARDAHQDPEQPRLDRRPARVERIPAAMHDQEHVLRGVLEDRIGHAEPPQVPPHEREVGVVEPPGREVGLVWAAAHPRRRRRRRTWAVAG